MTRTSETPAFQALKERFAARLPERLDALAADANTFAPGDQSAVLSASIARLHDLAGTAAPLGYPVLGDAARAAERRLDALAAKSDRLSRADADEAKSTIRSLILAAQTDDA